MSQRHSGGVFLIICQWGDIAFAKSQRHEITRLHYAEFVTYRATAEAGPAGQFLILHSMEAASLPAKSFLGHLTIIFLEKGEIAVDERKSVLDIKALPSFTFNK